MSDALDLVAKITTSVDKISTRNMENLKLLSEAYSEYVEAIRDSADARTEYIELVDKYEEGLEAANVLPAPSFLNVTGTFPTHNDEMVEDSKKMKDLAKTVSEVEEQRQFLEQRVQQLLRTVLADTSTTLDQASTLDSYLEQQLSALDSPYGSQEMPGVTPAT